MNYIMPTTVSKEHLECCHIEYKNLFKKPTGAHLDLRYCRPYPLSLGPTQIDIHLFMPCNCKWEYNKSTVQIIIKANSEHWSITFFDHNLPRSCTYQYLKVINQP